MVALQIASRFSSRQAEMYIPKNTLQPASSFLQSVLALSESALANKKALASRAGATGAAITPADLTPANRLKPEPLHA